ncbi:TOG array regulator of axonemal microtubules protein 1-like [Uloborus diversus]|uniref:TOG array regulator of axonemal microtubules protein 1-like n=1 Tax=Uloborus diversus TaxID=327109 RepID=UPI0024090B43|nr:TOG array regulator of axonemal microtubules protein 1-like [Uloborus diversus]
MFQNLLDYNASKRVEILIVMRKLLKNGNGDLPFHDASRNSIFDILYHVLDDSRWEVRYQCLLLIGAIIPYSSDEIDSCMLLVIPKIISNLGHENVNVRRAALQVLHVHMKYTNNLQNFQKMFIQHGLENLEFIVRKGCIMSIGILFTNDFENENLFPLIECLAKHFVDGDASLFYPIFLAMQKINELIGNPTFDLYLQKLDDEAANTYRRVLNKFTSNDSRMSSSSGSRSSFMNANGMIYNVQNKLLKYDFGIFQPYIMEKIRSEDWKTRVEAIEHMKALIREMPDFCEKISDMDEYMLFLSKLLEDSNFKIIIQTLSVYDLLIEKFKNQMKRFLKTFVTSVLKRLGDAKLVVREHAIRVIHKLMHHIKPTEVLGNLLHHKDNRNPRLREEIINRVTAAVLTFPSYNFDFQPLCEAVAPLLTDSKRRVRLASVECFAALAQAMGPTRLVPLVSAVDTVEINYDTEGLLSAVQARLARRILPRCTEDGAVSYAITLPSSAGCQSRNSFSWGSDIDWIMAASGSSSSSTPPSRSKETFMPSTEQNGDFSVLRLGETVKSKDQEFVSPFRKADNAWLKSATCDAPSNFLIFQSADNDGGQDQWQRLNFENLDKKVKSVVISNSEKTSVLIPASYSERKFHDSVKTKPVISSSKIPVLARSSEKKTSEDTIALKQTRALSAERQNILPSFHRYSASHRRSSNHIMQENRIQNVGVDRKETILQPVRHVESLLGLDRWHFLADADCRPIVQRRPMAYCFS